ncbi:MAG: methyl-accepting chemotaxis protein, partial [Bradyrhizobium sp.]|nr:methyl-accepting chemotaxis protein [Bradyrhizobium sp.]
MMNLSSLSKAMFLIVGAGATIVAIGVARVVLGPSTAPWDTAIEFSIVGAMLVSAAWALRQTASNVREVASVCVRARHGDLEARILGTRNQGDLGKLQAAVDDMLDIVDAYVRESSASMEYVSRGKCFRKVLVRGFPGSFRNGATVINAGTDYMDRRVSELARVAQGFGASMDNVARTLATAVTELEADAHSMAAAAEETSRQSTGVAAASEQASGNVQTVASAAEELSASINEISRQVIRSTHSTNHAV